MALDALQRYEPSKAKMKTYLMSQLQGLRRVSAQEQEIISIPEQIKLDQQHVHRVGSEMRDWLGRDPSDLELADKTGLSMKRLGHIRKATTARTEGSFMSTGEEGTEEAYAPAVRSLQQPASDPWHEFVYYGLDPTDQLIMEHTLGLRHKPILSNQDLARKLGVTPGAVSQRKARIQKQLNQRESLGVL
jgi:DNA-directed RNA polymerase specialized sigma subunit